MPIVTLLTDFGTSDHYVGVMKGVILARCSGATLVDITHEVPAWDIASGAYLLAEAWRWFPAGTTHLVVVDPGVGSSRRALAARANGHVFITPDNGILTMALAGCDTEVHEITSGDFFHQPLSTTFHGRDLFAPAAAEAAKGREIHTFGPAITDWVRLNIAEPVPATDRQWNGAVLHVDRFGNVITNFRFGQFPAPASITISGQIIADFASAYAASPPGKLFAIAGSSGYWELSINNGDAAQELGGSAALRQACARLSL